MASAERGFEYYLPVLVGELFPWSMLIVLPLAVGWRRSYVGDDSGPSALRRLLLCWVVVIVAAFSFSQTKLDLYIFPVMPAVAALAADLVVRAGFGLRHRGVRVGLTTIGLVTAGLGVAVFWLFRGGYFELAHAPLAAVVLVVSGLGAFVLQWQRRFPAAVAVLAAGFIAFNYMLAGWILPEAERLKPVPAFIRVFERDHGPDARLGAYDLVMPSLVFYLDRSVERVGTADHAESFFRNGERWMTIRASQWPMLQARVPGLCEAARHPAFEARASDLIRGAKPDDIVLVKNRCSAASAARVP
jgi:4-amino-4-deoxy-L-arabinose transferase-like glycosyltransferase